MIMILTIHLVTFPIDPCLPVFQYIACTIESHASLTQLL